MRLWQPWDEDYRRVVWGYNIDLGSTQSWFPFVCQWVKSWNMWVHSGVDYISDLGNEKCERRCFHWNELILTKFTYVNIKGYVNVPKWCCVAHSKSSIHNCHMNEWMNKPLMCTREETEWGFILLWVQDKFPAPEVEAQSRKDNVMMKGPASKTACRSWNHQLCILWTMWLQAWYSTSLHLSSLIYKTENNIHYDNYI